LTNPSGTILGRYEIRSKIGAGGMGEVYLAQDTSELGRTVALKIVPAEVAKDKDRLQRFTREARAVSNLNQPTSSLFMNSARQSQVLLSPLNTSTANQLKRSSLRA
jgi:serine/threonine protein kinase